MADQEKITRIIVEDPHGNTTVDEEISTVERETVIAQHDADQAAHPYIRGLVEGAKTYSDGKLSDHNSDATAHQSIRESVSAASEAAADAQSEAESKVEEIYVGEESVVQTDPETGKKYVRFERDQFGKVDGIRVNDSQEDLPVDENGKVSIPVPTTVAELDDAADYATKEYVTGHTPTTVAELSDSGNYATKEYVTERVPKTVAELSDSGDYASKEYVAENTPKTVAELSDSSNYATKVEAQAMVNAGKITKATATTNGSVGVPKVTPTINGDTINFAFENIKGETGNDGATVILNTEPGDPSEPDHYKLYGEKGGNNDGAMTQKVVTEELTKYDEYINGVDKTTYELAGELEHYAPYAEGWGSYGVMQHTAATSAKVNRVKIGPLASSDGNITATYYIKRGSLSNKTTPANLTLVKQGTISLTTSFQQFTIELNSVLTLDNEALFVYYVKSASGAKIKILGANGQNANDPTPYTGTDLVYFNNSGNISDTWSAAQGNRRCVQPILRLELPPYVNDDIDARIELARPSIVAEASERAEEVNEELQEFKTDTDKTYKFEGEIEYYSTYDDGQQVYAKGTAQYYKNTTGKAIKVTSVVIGPVRNTIASAAVYYGIVLTTEANRTSYQAGQELKTGSFVPGTSFKSTEVKLTNEVMVPANSIICVYFYAAQSGSTTILGRRSSSTFDKLAGSNKTLYNGSKTDAWSVGNDGFVAVMPILKYHKDAGIKQAIDTAIEEELPSIKSEVETSVDAVDVYLPDTITAVVGDTLELFWRSIVKAVNPYDYDISVVCAKGSCLSRKYSYKPEAADVGSTTLTVRVRNRKGQLVGSAATTLVTVATPQSPASEKKVFCIGDSLTSPGKWPCESKRRLVGSSTVDSIVGSGLSNITFCGSKEATFNSTTAKFFGRGGWSWSTFQAAATAKYRVTVAGVGGVTVGATYTNNSKTFTVEEVDVTDGSGTLLLNGNGAPSSSGTLTRASGSGDATIAFSAYVVENDNPLWDSVNSIFSFIPYVTECGDGDIDVLYVLLSWNGQSAWKQYSVEDTTGQIASAKTFLERLHEEYPYAKVKVLGLQMPSVTDGLGKNYYCDQSYTQRFGLFVCAWNYNKALQDLCKSDAYSGYCEFVDVATQFDSEYNFPSGTPKVNKRNSTTYYAHSNGVHPADSGYNQIADVVWRNFVKNYCQG